MEKLTLVLAAVVMGFFMTSCGENTEEKVKKATDEFFAQAEQEVQAIDNADDFLAFCDEFTNRKGEFAQEIFAQFPKNDDGEALVPDEVTDFIYNRATDYNHVEAVKAAEFITPALDNLEASVNKLYEQFISGNGLDDESVLKFDEDYGVFSTFIYYDNVLPEIQDRCTTVGQKLQEMDAVLDAKLNELYGEE